MANNISDDEFTKLGAVPDEEFAKLGAIPENTSQQSSTLDALIKKLKGTGSSISDSLSGLKNLDSDTLSKINSAVRGALTEGTLHGNEVLGAAMNTAGSKIASLISPDETNTKPILDLYRQKLAEEQAGTEASKAANPITYQLGGAGGITGQALATAGLGPTVGAGTKLASAGTKSLMDILNSQGGMAAAKALGARIAENPIVENTAMGSGIGAISGTLGSKADEPDTIADTLVGAGEGALAGGAVSSGLKVGGAIVNKTGNAIANYLEDSPRLARLWEQAKQGFNKINPNSEQERQGLPGATNIDKPLDQQEMRDSQDILNKINQTKSDIQGDVHNSLQPARDANLTFDMSDVDPETLARFGKEAPEAAATEPSSSIINPQTGKPYQAKTPEAAPNTYGIDDLADMKRKIDYRTRSINNSSDKAKYEDEIKQIGLARDQIAQKIVTAAPEYATQAKRLATFDTMVPEQIASGATPIDIKNRKLWDMKNWEDQVFDGMQTLIRRGTQSGSDSDSARNALLNLKDGMQKFAKNEQDLIAQGKISKPAFTSQDADNMYNNIRQKSIESTSKQYSQMSHPQSSAESNLVGALLQSGGTGEAVQLGVLNRLGRVARLGSDTMGQVYQATDGQLSELANKMNFASQHIPGLAKYASSIQRGLQSGDRGAINAALFAMLQNPSARAFIGQEDLGPSAHEAPSQSSNDKGEPNASY